MNTRRSNLFSHAALAAMVIAAASVTCYADDAASALSMPAAQAQAPLDAPEQAVAQAFPHASAAPTPAGAADDAPFHPGLLQLLALVAAGMVAGYRREWR
jgi:hypothetical protein